MRASLSRSAVGHELEQEKRAALDRMLDREPDIRSVVVIRCKRIDENTPPLPAGPARQLECDLFMVGVHDEEQCAIGASLPDSGGLGPAVENEAESAGIWVLPLIGGHLLARR